MDTTGRAGAGSPDEIEELRSELEELLADTGDEVLLEALHEAAAEQFERAASAARPKPAKRSAA